MCLPDFSARGTTRMRGGWAETLLVLRYSTTRALRSSATHLSTPRLSSQAHSPVLEAHLPPLGVPSSPYSVARLTSPPAPGLRRTDVHVGHSAQLAASVASRVGARAPVHVSALHQTPSAQRHITLRMRGAEQRASPSNQSRRVDRSFKPGVSEEATLDVGCREGDEAWRASGGGDSGAPPWCFWVSAQRPHAHLYASGPGN
ncbi:hypothetical protein B0H13DRAFT_2036768, partial [Mycena leptocephala]